MKDTIQTNKLLRGLGLCLLAALVSLLTGCFNIGYVTGIGPQGGIYAQTKIGFSGNKVGHASKEGESCNIRILAFFTTGPEETVQSIAVSNNIKQVVSVDQETFNILTVFARQCTIVSGN